jgi:hypothetical protein
MIVAIAINAVGMSLIVGIAITITEPANAPTTAAVMPSTKALILLCLPYSLKQGAGIMVNK